MGAALGVGEPRGGGLGKIEGPRQERRHPGPGHRLVGTEAERVLCAADGDPQVGQPLDVGHPPLIVVHIGEPRLGDRGRVGAVEGSHDPHRHRPALRRIAGAELLLAALGALEQAHLRQRFDVGLVRAVRAAGDVGEPALGGRGRRQGHCCDRGCRGRCHESCCSPTSRSPADDSPDSHVCFERSSR